MPPTSSVGDVPAFEPKVQVTAKAWDPRISLAVTKGEMHEAQ